MKRQINSWTLAFRGFDPLQQGARESLFTLGNGYFAVRGAPADATADGTHYPGTYLAGGYNRLVSHVADQQIENEDLVNCPNALQLMVRLGDAPWLQLNDLEALEHCEELNMKEGVLHRWLRLRDEQGRVLRWQEERMVSMSRPHCAALNIELKLENWSGPVSVRSGIDGSVLNEGVARYSSLANRHLETLAKSQCDRETILLRSRMKQSRRELAIAARTRVRFGDAPAETEESVEETQNTISLLFRSTVSAGETVRIEKVVALHSSKDAAISEPAEASIGELCECGDFAELKKEHQLAWEHLWRLFGIKIDTLAGGDTELKLRLHIFQLLQTVSPHSVDLDVGVPARGWHGEAYRGHIFWDELFIFPFVNLRMPVITRQLLLYRHRRLPAARRAARSAGYKGAMFPWQSGSSGREESQRLHLNPMSGRWIADTSYLQRHVNAAIIYNVWQYLQVTEDHEFLAVYGAELMLEITRFWASMARYDDSRRRFHIEGVMGPDEFHTRGPASPEAAGVKNNAYTNIMVAWGVARTLDAWDMLPEAEQSRLRNKLNITEEEIEHWDNIGRKLTVPFHKGEIISQFEGYEGLEELDWEHYSKKYGDVRRLDRILEAEGDDANRYKVAKQADVLMLFYLFSTEELKEIFDRLGYNFSPEMIGRNIEYYHRRTSHGSTLSWVTHAWILSRWDRKGSWKFFKQALNSDFTDLQGGTTAEGIHLGAMAGSVDLVQRCYTGIEVRANMLSFNPLLPEELECLRTCFHYRGHDLDIVVTQRELSVSSRCCTAAPITIAYRGHVRGISPGQTYRFLLVSQPEKEPLAFNSTPSDSAARYSNTLQCDGPKTGEVG